MGRSRSCDFLLTDRADMPVRHCVRSPSVRRGVGQRRNCFLSLIPAIIQADIDVFSGLRAGGRHCGSRHSRQMMLLFLQFLTTDIADFLMINAVFSIFPSACAHMRRLLASGLAAGICAGVPVVGRVAGPVRAEVVLICSGRDRRSRQHEGRQQKCRQLFLPKLFHVLPPSRALHTVT
ncbi:hypothetical protein DSECCO2_616500 [anaerobic digester metagenome]